MTLTEQFLTKLPTGRTLGEEALLPINSYVGVVEALLRSRVPIHALLPGTGDGVGKLAFDHRPFTYRITYWVDVPPLFKFMMELGVAYQDCLKTFNMGIGFYVFLDPSNVDYAIGVAREAGHELVILGQVEEGERCVRFEPPSLAHIVLPPPGE